MIDRLVPGALVVAAATAAAAGEPRIDPLVARLDGDRVAVSFHVDGAMEAEALEHLRSGLPLEQRHRVEVLSRRAVPLWPSKVLARLRIDTVAAFDTLTEQYELSRTIERLVRGEAWARVSTEQQRTASLEEVRAWMSDFAALPALELPAAAPRSRLRVRVESTLGRRFVLYLFPGKLTASGELRLDP